jgi:uncharacterized membrane protein YkvA (DUF1232 family)
MIILSFKKIKRNIKKSIRLAKLLKKDKKVPKISKIFLAIAIGYFLSPIDLIPDFIPVIGQLDDLLIVPLLIFLAIKLIPRGVFLENYGRIFKK